MTPGLSKPVTPTHETRTRVHGYGFSWVRVRVQLEIPRGYPCHSLMARRRRGTRVGKRRQGWTLIASDLKMMLSNVSIPVRCTCYESANLPYRQRYAKRLVLYQPQTLLNQMVKKVVTSPAMAMMTSTLMTLMLKSRSAFNMVRFQRLTHIFSTPTRPDRRHT